MPRHARHGRRRARDRPGNGGEALHGSSPPVWGIRVTGRFQPLGVGQGPDPGAAPTVLRKGGTGKVLEFFGPGVAALDLAARATIANMSVDMGATACVFPSDADHPELDLGAERPGADWAALSAENGARNTTR